MASHPATQAVGVITVYSGLCSLYLHPAEHMGDRTALILVAALIITTSFQSDLGLGKLHYLIWWGSTYGKHVT